MVSLSFVSSAAGMRVLRKHNVVHRDIKPSNILIKECKDKKIVSS